MLDTLTHIFSAVCGQNPEHTWAPGGLLLPCCQRCTGLYAGALVAAVLHVFHRPHLSGRFLLIHGLFLLQMVPFGYHWLPQGPVLRTETGILFGFGIATFLWVVPAAWLAPSAVARCQPWPYWIGCAATVLLLPAACQLGGKPGAFVLALLIGGGALALAGLVLANASAGCAALARWRRHAV